MKGMMIVMTTEHFSDSKLSLTAKRKWTNQVDSQNHVNYVRAQMVSPKFNPDFNWLKRDSNIVNSSSRGLDNEE